MTPADRCPHPGAHNCRLAPHRHGPDLELIGVLDTAESAESIWMYKPSDVDPITRFAAPGTTVQATPGTDRTKPRAALVARAIGQGMPRTVAERLTRAEIALYLDHRQGQAGAGGDHQPAGYATVTAHGTTDGARWIEFETPAGDRHEAPVTGERRFSVGQRVPVEQAPTGRWRLALGEPGRHVVGSYAETLPAGPGDPGGWPGLAVDGWLSTRDRDRWAAHLDQAHRSQRRVNWYGAIGAAWSSALIATQAQSVPLTVTAYALSMAIFGGWHIGRVIHESRRAARLWRTRVTP